MNDNPSPFGLRSIVVAALAAIAYCALMTAVIGKHAKLLDVLLSVWEIASLSCGAAVLIGIALAGLTSGRDGRQAAPVIGIALASLAAHVVLFITTLRRDNMAIFEESYLHSVAVLVPGILLGVLIAVAGLTRQLSRVAVVGLGVWVAAMSWAHLLVIAVASGSV